MELLGRIVGVAFTAVNSVTHSGEFLDQKAAVLLGRLDHIKGQGIKFVLIGV